MYLSEQVLRRGSLGMGAALTGILLMMASPVARAQDYTWVTNGGTITITGYTGPGGDVVRPLSTIRSRDKRK